MANKIEITTIDPQKNGLAAPMSRYTTSQVIYYGDAKKMTYATYVKNVANINKSDRYAVIPPGYEYRPDRASIEAYGIPDLWWKIMEANNIKDIFDFKAGRTIRLPENI
jgi:hypothetical protein